MPQSGVLFWKSSVFQVKSHVLSTNEVSCNATKSETIWNKQTNIFQNIKHDIFFLRREKFPHVKLDERNVESENGNNPEDLKFLLTGFSVNLFVSFGNFFFPPNNPARKLFSSWGEILSVCFTMKTKKDYWKNKSC